MPAGNTAWMTLAELFQTGSAPPEGKPSSAAQTNLPPGLTEWHMHGPELKGEDGQGGMMREGAKERRAREKREDERGRRARERERQRGV